MIKVKYVDKSPTTKSDCTVTCDDKQAYVNLDELNKDNTGVSQYATFEYNRTLLNGKFYDLSDIPPTGQVYISESMSNESGNFTTPIVMIRTFTQYHTSPGISFMFDNNDDECWCKELNIKWYRDDTLLSDVTYMPKSTIYFCQQNVAAFNKIVITFYSTSKPYRYLRIFNIDDGVDREFKEDELYGLKIIEEISESSDTLSINTADININAKTDVDFIFQRTQPIYIYKNENLICKTFNSESTREIEHKYSIYSEDYIGILDKEQFLGGIYINYSLKSLLDDICGGIPHDYIGSETISGYLPVKTRREALQYVAFATCKVIDCSRSEKIQVKTLSDVPKAIDKSRVMRNPTESTETIVTQIILAEHMLKANLDSSELINEVVNGTYTFTFGEPHHSYSIIGGTLVNSGPNYATITGTGNTVILTANGYDDVIKQLTIENPIVVATDLPNVIERLDNQLITSSNSETVLQHLSEIYFRNKTLSAKVFLEDEMVGDLVTIPTSLGAITGRITVIGVDLINGLADLTILEV